MNLLGYMNLKILLRYNMIILTLRILPMENWSANSTIIWATYVIEHFPVATLCNKEFDFAKTEFFVSVFTKWPMLYFTGYLYLGRRLSQQILKWGHSLQYNWPHQKDQLCALGQRHCATKLLVNLKAEYNCVRNQSIIPN